ncbi:hypothetical protein SAMN04487897_109112 [Paenibacillus sp. yr247]|uniref:hypothetical protein n=1 Tax=Paenibacillus sp. yr247 TaxID=1761880 RepID=UPI00088277A8|nr:hypothetical protein [Paenibacillus sp. yr247]SDO17735.1 hypothetical protein SAMN04487897_109112 [Paenibacillus sp. yr247]
MAKQPGYKAIVHYYLQKSCWSIHFQSCCYTGAYVYVSGAWETEVKPNRPSNPRGWVTARSVQITFFCAEDAGLPVNRKLLEELRPRIMGPLKYDKNKVSFNVTEGTGGVLFTPEGAFVLKPEVATMDLFSFAEHGMNVNGAGLDLATMY